MGFVEDLYYRQAERATEDAWLSADVTQDDPVRVTDPAVLAYVAEALPYLRRPEDIFVGMGPDGLERAHITRIKVTKPANRHAFLVATAPRSVFPDTAILTTGQVFSGRYPITDGSAQAAGLLQSLRYALTDRVLDAEEMAAS
jgi:hypothetical protein